jgi:hypothetical protein
LRRLTPRFFYGCHMGAIAEPVVGERRRPQTDIEIYLGSDSLFPMAVI